MARAQVQVSEDDDMINVKFEENMRDITPGQVAALYLHDEVLGAGFIQPGMDREGE
jgi:tRNA U34 2-thiouridine synthase MnmA/TrmU